MRRSHLVVWMALLAAALPGCAASNGPAQPPSTAPADSPQPSAAIGLVGLWRVSDAAGEGPETWLRLGAGEMSLWIPCGELDGSWRADDTHFLAGVYGGAGSCFTRSTPADAATWLLESTGYRKTDAGWQLLDAEGVPTATLTENGAPTPGPDIDPRAAEPPVIDDRTRALFAAGPELPTGLIAARGDEIEGRWVPADAASPTDPNVVFSADGGWTASDGCNGAAGRWVLGSRGLLLTTSGASTDIGCTGAPVPQWVGGTRTAALDGTTLVLLDASGAELGRLTRG